MHNIYFYKDRRGKEAVLEYMETSMTFPCMDTVMKVVRCTGKKVSHH